MGDWKHTYIMESPCKHLVTCWIDRCFSVILVNLVKIFLCLCSWLVMSIPPNLNLFRKNMFFEWAIDRLKILNNVHFFPLLHFAKSSYFGYVLCLPWLLCLLCLLWLRLLCLLWLLSVGSFLFEGLFFGGFPFMGFRWFPLWRVADVVQGLVHYFLNVFDDYFQPNMCFDKFVISEIFFAVENSILPFGF